VLTQTMLVAGRANFDLMELVVSHLDTAQVWYPDEQILYSLDMPLDCAAYEIFADIPIPFTAVEPHKPCPLCDHQMSKNGDMWECANGHAQYVWWDDAAAHGSAWT